MLRRDNYVNIIQKRLHLIKLSKCQDLGKYAKALFSERGVHIVIKLTFISYDN